MSPLCRLFVALSCAALLIFAPIMAAGLSFDGKVITLDEDEQEACKQDGCILMTRTMFLNHMKKAQDEGFARACGS